MENTNTTVENQTTNPPISAVDPTIIHLLSYWTCNYPALRPSIGEFQNYPAATHRDAFSCFISYCNELLSADRNRSSLSLSLYNYATIHWYAISNCLLRSWPLSLAERRTKIAGFVVNLYIHGIFIRYVGEYNVRCSCWTNRAHNSQRYIA